MSDEYRIKQNQYIKKILYDAYISSKLTYNGLKDLITKSLNFPVSYNTIVATLNTKTDTAPNIYVMIAMSRIFNLDTGYLFSDPQINSEPLYVTEKMFPESKFHKLIDKKYQGTFYGFLLSPNLQSDEIIRFELTIDDSAQLIYTGHPIDENNAKIIDKRVLTGTPIVSTTDSNVFIVFTNNSGDFYILYYDCQPLRTLNLYYRRGIVLTTSSLQGHHPLIQSFVLLKRNVSASDNIRGLLGNVDPKFYITKEDMEYLCAQNNDISEFFKKYEYLLKPNCRSVYEIDEDVLLSLSNKSEINSLINVILKLKTKSIIKPRTVYKEHEEFIKYGKEVLQMAHNQ